MTTTLSTSPDLLAETNLGTTQWGMISFLASEAAFFATLDRGLPNLSGKRQSGPNAVRGALSAFGFVHDPLPSVEQRDDPLRGAKASKLATRRAFGCCGRRRSYSGMAFLLGTAYEWRELITRHHLTISRNLFGTTYYTLVGFHGLHVTAGVVVMLIMLGLAVGRQVTAQNGLGIEMVSWYWHFVDGVWLVVFTVVYLVGR